MLQFGTGTFILSITAFEVQLHHRKEPVPQKISSLFGGRCKKSVNNSNNSFANTRTGKADTDCGKTKTWSDIISTVDFVLFLISLLLDCTVTFVTLAMLSTKYH